MDLNRVSTRVIKLKEYTIPYLPLVRKAIIISSLSLSFIFPWKFIYACQIFSTLNSSQIATTGRNNEEVDLRVNIWWLTSWNNYCKIACLYFIRTKKPTLSLYIFFSHDGLNHVNFWCVKCLREIHAYVLYPNVWHSGNVTKSSDRIVFVNLLASINLWNGSLNWIKDRILLYFE